MRSVRLPADLEARIDRVAELEGVSRSEIIRVAVARYCEERLSSNLRDRLGDVIGVVSSGKLRARETGRAFTDLLVKKRKTQAR